MDRLLLLSFVAVTWPWWGPVLREILKDIHEVAVQDDLPQPGDKPAAKSKRHERLVNTPWDTARLGRKRGSQREPDSTGAAPRGRL